MKHPELDYKSPVKFTLKQKTTLTLASSAIAWAMKAICGTCRTEVRDEQHLHEVFDHGRHTICVFWHETLALAAWHHRNTGYHTLTSYSYDGELAARVIAHFGQHAVRGSSSRGGSSALVQMEMATKLVPLFGFTPDGPRGPRRVAKPGPALLSARSGLRILPQAFIVTPCWRTNSWDRLMLPKPFSRIVTRYGRPIDPPEDQSRECIQEATDRVQKAINTLQEELEAEFEGA